MLFIVSNLFITIPVINSRLSRLSTTEASRNQPHQHPPSILLSDHQRASTISLARILPSIGIPCTQHLWIQDDIYPSLLVQVFTFLVFYQWHIHDLQHLGPFLFLGYEEGQWSKFLVRYNGTPACCICYCASLNNVHF